MQKVMDIFSDLGKAFDRDILPNKIPRKISLQVLNPKRSKTFTDFKYPYAWCVVTCKGTGSRNINKLDLGL